MMNEVATIPHQNGSIEGHVVARPGPGALAQTDQQRAIAEVQAAMMIARANPRDEKRALDRILNACQRQRLAEAAVYSYSRGGSEISGPSIRLAEALAQNWGNIQFGIREIEQRGDESTVQAFAWDVETNVKREMVFTVRHVRHTKRGSYKLDDPRDIYEMVANNGARRLRSCILAVIPGDVIDEAVEQCEVTMRAKADTSPEAVQKMVVAFEQMGVSQQQIEQRIQRRLNSIQPAQIVSLKKIYASLRDGMSTAADWFEPVETAEDEAKTGNAGAKAALKKAAPKKDNEQNTQEASGTAREAPGAEESTSATSVEDGASIDGPASTMEGAVQAHSDDNDQAAHPAQAKADEIIGEIKAASAIIDVNSIVSRYGSDLDAMPEAISEAIRSSAEQRKKAIKGEREKAGAAA